MDNLPISTSEERQCRKRVQYAARMPRPTAATERRRDVPARGAASPASPSRSHIACTHGAECAYPRWQTVRIGPDPQDSAVARPRRIPSQIFRTCFLGQLQASSAMTFCRSFQTSAFAGGFRKRYAGYTWPSACGRAIHHCREIARCRGGVENRFGGGRAKAHDHLDE